MPSAESEQTFVPGDLDEQPEQQQEAPKSALSKAVCGIFNEFCLTYDLQNLLITDCFSIITAFSPTTDVTV